MATTRVKVEARDLGQMLVARGLLLPEELAECEEARRQAAESGQTVPSLADLLVQKGFLSRPQVEDAYAALRGKMRFCPRCDLPVYIPLVGPAGEKCPQCREGLEWREDRRDVRVDDTSMILTASDLPPEVAEAAKDTARRFGKYVLVEQVGRGGAAIVHKAWDTYLGQYVALKFIRPRAAAATDTDQARAEHESRILDLIKEARNTIKLRHANIVPVYDAGRIGKEFYIAMEYLEGNTLAEHVSASRKRGAVSPLYEDHRLYLAMFRDVAMAVHHAHTREKPIMHCDLKPGNIIIDMQGKPWILDFGLAMELRDPEAGEDTKGLVRGTPAYMAPEQAAGKYDAIDPRTDVYALGGILYELIAGVPPFWGNVLEIVRQVQHQPPQPPLQRTEGKALAGGSRLEEICLRCLEKEKDRRWRSALELAEEIEKVLRLTDTAVVRGKLMRTVGSPKAGLPHLDEQRQRLDAEIAVLNIEGARRGFRELAAATQDPVVRSWVESCLLEIGWVEALKTQMIERLNRQRPTVPKLELLDKAIENVEILKATERKIVIYSADKANEIPWAALRPQTIVALAEGVCGLTSPQDRLSLGIYCWKALLKTEAQRELTAALGTGLADLEQSAQQYLALLGQG